jgi:ribosomal protein S18 acetylase RimI-like enzyme
MIRTATKQDCPAMLALINELALYEKAPQEVTITLDHFIESGFGDKPVYWAFVAEENNNIVGFALCYTRFSTWKGQRCYLEDLIVTENYRSKGIGKQLMDKVLQDAQEKNYHGVSWQVLDWNTNAIEFYKKYKTNFDAKWINCMVTF